MISAIRVSKKYGDPSADIVVLRLVGEHESDESIDLEVGLIEKLVIKNQANVKAVDGNPDKNQMVENQTKKNMSEDTSWCFATIPVNDWAYDMTPWETEVNFGMLDSTGNKSRCGGAGGKLKSILDEVIPEFEGGITDTIDNTDNTDRVNSRDIRDITNITEKSYATNNNRRYILAGYSLAGLFSLWSAYQTDSFMGVVAASPSVWYPGLMEYIRANDCKSQYVYLSLGNKEPKTRNALMSGIGDNIKDLTEILQKQGIDVFYESNPGNHFFQVTERMAKGIAYMINKIRET